ncbi:MAG TPA: hypothetical protein VFF73_33595 [Planctomycetota bacterium]|nr:hypothetical protein [Planctomycetota bacterium]
MTEAARPRRRLLVEAAAVFLLACLGVWREHRSGGVDMPFLALLALIAAGSLRGFLAIFAPVPPPPRPVFFLDVAALGALLDGPEAVWGHALALSGALLAAFPGATLARRPSWAERAALVLALAIAVAAVLATRHSLERAAPWAAVPLALLALVTVLGAPWAEAGDPVRQATGLGVVTTAGLVHAHSGFPAYEAECLALAAALLVALLELFDLALRFRVRNDHERLMAARRRLAFAAIALGVPLTLAWAAGEVVLRRLPPDPRTHGSPIVDDRRGNFHAPGVHYVFPGPVRENPEPRDVVRNEFVWNKEGFHDLDHELRKPASCIRVVFLGDSFIDCPQLRLEDVIHRRLEGPLQKAAPAPLTVEAMAYGTCGWCQIQERDVLREKALAYRPDLVLMEFLPANDVFENDSGEESIFKASADERGTLARFVSGVARHRGLFFTGFITERLGALLPGANKDPMEEIWRDPVPADHAALWEGAWTKTEKLVGEIAELVQRAGARLVVVVFSNAPEVEDYAVPDHKPDGHDWKRPSRRMASICQRVGVPCLELSPRLARRSAAVRDQMFLVGDGHWSSVGHACAAEEVARYLVEETTIWREVVERARRP